MNNIHFNQTGGFPLETNTLDEMQTAYRLFNSLGAIAGNLTFISGGIVTGNNISSGSVYINGEVLEFRGGTVASTVVIIEEIEKKFFENGEEKGVFHTRYAQCGSGVTTYPLADFKNPMSTKEIPTELKKLTDRLDKLEKQNAVFQAGGGMVLWNKPADQIPPGWQEVVNWQGRMPIGAGNYTSPTSGWLHGYQLGHTGGDTERKITNDQVPWHTHSYQDSYMLETKNYGGISGVETLNNAYNGTHAVAGGKRFLHYKNGTTGGSGGSQPINIVSPYRVVLFIEYIG